MRNATACISDNNLAHCPSAALTFSQRLSQALVLARHWQINQRTRRQLAQLDSHQLKDIGISHGDALEEASKPFWKN